METNLIELENILTFLGMKFIDYKGQRVSNGHEKAKTIGEIKEFFGKEVMCSGMAIESYETSKMFDFNNNWNDLMFLVEKLDYYGASIIIGRFFCEIKYTNPLNETQDFSTRIASGVKLNAVYGACVQFVEWINNLK